MGLSLFFFKSTQHSNRWLLANHKSLTGNKSVDYRAALDDDKKKKESLIQKFASILRNGLPFLQHAPGHPGALAAKLRLRGENDLTWEGGVGLSSSGRKLHLSNVQLVSAGKTAGSFGTCDSARYADERTCLSLVCFPGLLSMSSIPDALNLEFPHAEEALVVGYALSLAVTDGYDLKYEEDERESTMEWVSSAVASSLSVLNS